MPVGLEIYNDSGVIQIGSERKNFGLVAKGTLTLDQNLPQTTSTSPVMKSKSVTVAGATAPICAYRSTASGASLYYITVSGSDWTFHLCGVSGETVDYWIFDEIPVSTPETFGLETFNAAGQPIFHSSRGGMPVVDVVGPLEAHIQSYPGGRTYASIANFAGGPRDTAVFKGVFVGNFWWNAVWSGANFTRQETQVVTSPDSAAAWPFNSAGAVPYYGNGPQHVIVDVTGL